MRRSLKTMAERVTVDEFYRLVPDGQKADLLDGIIYMPSPDTTDELTGFVRFLMQGYNAARRLGGQVRGSRFAFRLSRYRAPEPDVAYVRPQRTRLVGKKDMKGGPDAAVEVVSRDSRRRDYVDKKKASEEAAVGEYWIIAPLKRQVRFYRLVDGRYQLVSLEGGHIFRSAVLPGFWLDVRWLWQDPLPNAYDCLQVILKSTRRRPRDPTA